MAEKEYIEREAALSAQNKSMNLAECRKRLERIPAADVRPVVRGMWTKELHPNVRYNQYKCSVCGKFSGHDEEGWIWKPNFCPNCGADMRPKEGMK